MKITFLALFCAALFAISAAGQVPLVPPQEPEPPGDQLPAAEQPRQSDEADPPDQPGQSQEPTPAAAPPREPSSAGGPVTEEQALAAAAQRQRERERDQERRADPFEDVYLYFPEGELDIRTARMIRNVLFEGRINYGFVDGDIETHLRYKYYARRFTWRLGVFDSIGFDSVDSGSGDFDRVRGGSLLFEAPRDYTQRYVGLLQVDDYAFGDVDRPDNNRTNTFVKFGYQFGTPFDPTLNRITGDTRGRIVPVLTAYRELGPRDFSWATGLSLSSEILGGDYEYLRFEAEALKRMYLTRGTFLISRFHVGAFPLKEARDFALDVPADPEDRDPFRAKSFLYAPREELFRIGGREALRGVDDSIRGTEQVHLTNEFFFPVFLNEAYDTMRLRWVNLYGIAYVGAGAFGFDVADLLETDGWIVDAGVGFEAELRYRDVVGYLSVLYAQPVMKPEGIDGGEFLVSLRTRR